MSKETHHYLELYTNNYSFSQTFVEMKGIGREPIFAVSNLKGRTRNLQDKSAIKDFDGQLNTEDNTIKHHGQNEEYYDEKKGGLDPNKNLMGLVNESDSASGSAISHRGYDSHRGLFDKEAYNMLQDMDNEVFEGESNKSDQIDDGTMNVFGFNDDLNMDDRIII